MSLTLSPKKIATSKLDRLLFRLMGWNAKPSHARFMEVIGTEELSAAELAGQAGVPASYVYPICKQLEAFGLLRRLYPKMRAKTVFRLTPSGLALLNRSKT